MLDIRLIREQPEVVQASLARRGATIDLDAIRAKDEQRRALIGSVEQLRNERNTASKAIGAAKGRGEDAAAEMAAVKELGEKLAAQEAELEQVATELDAALVDIPNLVADDVPDGGEDEGSVVRTFGDKPSFSFEARDHLDLGTALGMIDMERGARTSGSRFAYLLGDAVRLQFALVQLALSRLGDAGFTPVVPPVLVREQAMWGTGFFPADTAQIYRIPEENHDLFLVGTSEVPLASFHADEILDEEQLPLRYVGISPCFRREAGSAGKDTRGIFRVHQFDKVEMFSFTTPEASAEEHEFILAQEEGIVQALGLHYRVVNIASGDLGASAAKKYDIEAWLPSQERYREITSCSNCTDYQARRLKARFRRDGKPEIVHTLNGTAIAIGRMLIALLETHQQEDGSILVPEVLVQHGAPTVIGAEIVGA
jgi:seryl-tRNA synthetase